MSQKTKYSNYLRIIKWFFLNLSINEKKCLEDSYADEIEIKILEDIVPLFFGQSSIFLDIGANIGLYSYYILPVLPQNAKCIAFEPRSETYLRLNKNVIDEKNRFKAEKSHFLIELV